MGEKLTGEALLGSAIFIFIPLVMAVLSLTLKDKINRWANIIAGIAFTVLNIISLVEGSSLDLSIFAYGLLADALAIVALIMIVWYAYRWQKD